MRKRKEPTTSDTEDHKKTKQDILDVLWVTVGHDKIKLKNISGDICELKELVYDELLKDSRFISAICGVRPSELVVLPFGSTVPLDVSLDVVDAFEEFESTGKEPWNVVLPLPKKFVYVRLENEFDGQASQFVVEGNIQSLKLQFQRSRATLKGTRPENLLIYPNRDSVGDVSKAFAPGKKIEEIYLAFDTNEGMDPWVVSVVEEEKEEKEMKGRIIVKYGNGNGNGNGSIGGNGNTNTNTVTDCLFESSPSKKRKFEPHIERILHHFFSTCQRPNQLERLSLREATGLELKQIDQWFVNRRRRVLKKQEKLAKQFNQREDCQ